MNLLELCNYYWWSIDDNPANPLLMDKQTLVQLINQARQDLAKDLNIIKEVTLVPDANGVVDLPEDLILPLRVIWEAGGNTTELTPIYDINLANVGSLAVTQYIFLERLRIQIFDKPPEAGVVRMWYKAYPDDLVEDTDVPDELPVEYHELLVTVYVRSRHAIKLGQFAVYQNLAALWEDIKRELAGVVDVRIKPVVAEREYLW